MIGYVCNICRGGKAASRASLLARAKPVRTGSTMSLSCGSIVIHRPTPWCNACDSGAVFRVPLIEAKRARAYDKCSGDIGEEMLQKLGLP